MNKPKIVLANGVFDILHMGHLLLLKEAKKLGDFLIVAIDSHERVKKIKPGRPINDEASRVQMLESLIWVDRVIVFNNDISEVIEIIKPDFLVKGGDYKAEDVVGRDFVESYGGKVVIIPTLQGYSTTDIIKRIREQ